MLGGLCNLRQVTKVTYGDPVLVEALEIHGDTANFWVERVEQRFQRCILGGFSR